MITAKEANKLSEKLRAEKNRKFQKLKNEIRKEDLKNIDRIIRTTNAGIEKRINKIVITYGTAEYLKTLGYRVRCVDRIDLQGHIVNNYEIEWGDDEQ